MTAMPFRPLCYGSVAVLFLFTANVWAAALTPGNLLVGAYNVIYEYTVDGQIVQSFGVPYGGGSRPVAEYTRDVAVDAQGRILVYNGTDQAYLSILDPAGPENWIHYTTDGLSSLHNLNVGGIAVHNNHAILTDETTGYAGGNDFVAGLVSFDLQTGDATRYLYYDYVDVNLGRDGLLYALMSGINSTNVDRIHIIDPETFEIVDIVNLYTTGIGHIIFAAQADSNGDIYAIDNRNIYRINSAGDLLASMYVCDLDLDIGCLLADVDLAADGTVILGDSNNNVLLTDRDFSFLDSFHVPTRASVGRPVFTFPIPVPIGPSWLFLVSGVPFLRWRHLPPRSTVIARSEATRQPQHAARNSQRSARAAS